MVARLCIAHLVWMEISKLHYLANYPSVGAEGLFAVPQKDRRRTALFRSHTIAALDNVGAILWSDCRFAIRHARGTAGFRQIRRSLPRAGARCHHAVAHSRSDGFPAVAFFPSTARKPSFLGYSPRKLSPVRARFPLRWK